MKNYYFNLSHKQFNIDHIIININFNFLAINILDHILLFLIIDRIGLASCLNADHLLKVVHAHANMSAERNKRDRCIVVVAAAAAAVFFIS